MKAKSLSDAAARQAIETRRNGSENYTMNDTNIVGEGEHWDESKADQALSILSTKAGNEKRLDVENFDRIVCADLHRTLTLTPDVAASRGFWRWLAVEKFSDLIERRHGSPGKPAHLRNYGIDKPVTENRIAILWFRAEMLYDSRATDPYHLAMRSLDTDFLESGIIRPKYAWCRNLARALVQFQYRDPLSNRPYLRNPRSNDQGRPDRGIRELYKRLRRMHSIMAFELMSDDALWQMLDEQSHGLERA